MTRFFTLFLVLINLHSVAQMFDPETIRKDKNYYWGEGIGNNSREAYINALENLTTSISVLVTSRFDQKMLEKRVVSGDRNYMEFTETVNSVINTYSNVTVHNTDRITLQTTPYYRIFVYITKADVERAFEQRRSRVLDFIGMAENAFDENDMGQALRYYYWANSLLGSLPEANNVSYSLGRREVQLVHHIHDRIAQILTRLQFSVFSVEDGPMSRVVNLLITYKNETVRNLDVICQQSYRSYVVRDGQVALEYFGHEANQVEYVEIEVEYAYAHEIRARRDDELKTVFEAMGELKYLEAKHKISLMSLFSVNSEPPGASIAINGHSIGVTPLNANLVYGNYTVEITKSGYSTEVREISLDGKPLKELSVRLQRSTLISFQSNPGGARLYLDSVFAGNTPFTWEMAYGSYLISAFHDDQFMEYSIEIFERGARAFTFNIPQKEKKIMVNDIEFEMVYVQGDTFRLGCMSDRIRDCISNEVPGQMVFLDDFYIGKYEISREQYLGILNPDTLKSDKFLHTQHPMVSVTYTEVRYFLNILNHLAGQSFRLPTEAEWEFAALGGLHRDYNEFAGGDDMFDLGWYFNNSGGQTHPVGQQLPNQLGIYDMSGNAWEWCSDWYGQYVFYDGIMQNPQGPSQGERKSIRGGGWSSTVDECRVKARSSEPPYVRKNTIGFRLVTPFVRVIEE